MRLKGPRFRTWIKCTLMLGSWWHHILPKGRHSLPSQVTKIISAVLQAQAPQEKMDTAPALLLLLALGFCEYGHGVVQPLHWEGQRKPFHQIQYIGLNNWGGKKQTKTTDFEVCSVSLEGKTASPQPAKGSWRGGCSTCTGKGDWMGEWFWRAGRRVEKKRFIS